MKRGGFLRRWSPLRRGAPLKRRKRLPRVNRKRKAKRDAEAFGPQAALCRTLPCACCHRPPMPWWRVDPHHEPPRSQGGKDEDTAPLCWKCHDLRHFLGLRGFEARTGLDVRAAVLTTRRLLIAEVRPTDDF